MLAADLGTNAALAYSRVEVQRIELTGTPTGTFTLTYSGATTGAIQHNATAAQIQTALRALSTINGGHVQVTGPNGGPWRVSFIGSFGDKDAPQISANGSGLTGGSITTSTEAQGGVQPTRSATQLVTSYDYKADDVQKVTITGNPSSGTFALTYSGQTTTALDHNATAAQVQAALVALNNIEPGEVLVSGPVYLPNHNSPTNRYWLVRFAGAKGGINQPAMTATGTGLTISVSTESQGGDAGRLQSMTDPRGISAKTDYDLAGRPVRRIEAFTDFNPSAADDRTAEFAYDGSDHLVELTAALPLDTSVTPNGNRFQKTQYVYGVVKGTDGNDLSSNELLKEVRYPDKNYGSASSASGEVEKLSYNALGQVKKRSDRNASTHEYEFDVLGRLTVDKATALGSSPPLWSVDGAVQRLETAYDTAGRAFKFSSFAAAGGGGAPVNQVERTFNGFGQLISEAQSHNDVVTGSTPKVQYGYSFVASGASPNHSRPKDMTYPNGRVLTYNYAGLDDSISRVSSLGFAGTTVESYAYLGLGTVVERAHTEPGVNLTYIQTGATGEAGDQYVGLDRFGRVIDQRWVKGATNTDRFGYGYDRNGKRLYRDNLLTEAGAAVFDELYHAGGAGGGYDNLNQLTAFKRGTLNGTKDDIPSSTRNQSWALDAMGNLEHADHRRHPAKPNAQFTEPNPERLGCAGSPRVRQQRQPDEG